MTEPTPVPDVVQPATAAEVSGIHTEPALPTPPKLAAARERQAETRTEVEALIAERRNRLRHR